MQGNGHLAQLVEATDLGSVQYRFESYDVYVLLFVLVTDLRWTYMSFTLQLEKNENDFAEVMLIEDERPKSKLGEYKLEANNAVRSYGWSLVPFVAKLLGLSEQELLQMLMEHTSLTIKTSISANKDAD